MLETFVADGTVTLVALGALAVEFAVIVALSLARRTRPSPLLVANALSGLFLILALRSALLGEGGGPIALFLGLAGVAHVFDVIFRLRRH